MKQAISEGRQASRVPAGAKKILLVLLASAALSYGLERLAAFLFYRGDAFYFGRYIAIFACAEMAGLFFCFRDVVAKRVEIAVFVVVLSVGTVYAAALPASCGISWDDEWHYYYPMLMSHVLSPGITGAELYYIENFTDTALDREGYDRESQEKLYQKVDGLYQPDKKGLVDRTWPRPYYLPAAFGLWLGRVANLPYHMTFILGRWMNLLFYACLSFLAVRRLQSGKMIAAVVLLLPFNIFMAASYSYDPWVTAWFLYGFCFYFGELQQPEKKIRTWEWLCMALAFFLGAGPKLLYIPMMLAILFLPKEKFESKKQRRALLLLAAGLTALGLGAMGLSFALPGSGGGVGDVRGGDGVDPMGQIAYIFSHPLAYTKILLSDYVSPQMASQYMGYLHYFTNLQPAPCSALMLVTLMVVGFTDKSRRDLEVSVLQRGVTLTLSFGVLCLAATSMYLAFTEVGNDEILGCQYRYIAPVIFPVLYCIGSGRIENRMRREYYNGAALAVCALSSITTVWTYAIDLY